MSYCLAPLNNNFSINGTCGKKSIPKSKLFNHLEKSECLIRPRFSKLGVTTYFICIIKY